MENENELGFCKFCGQSQIVHLLGEGSQEDRDKWATEMCHCQGAEAERRRIEREEKINAYIEKHFAPSQKQFVLDCVEVVKDWDSEIDEVTIKSGCKQTKIWVNADEYICFKTKETEDDELKV